MSQTAASRRADLGAELDRLAEAGALDSLAWALTGVLLSAAERLAPEAKTPAEAAWTVVRRRDQQQAAETADNRRPPGGGAHY